MCKVLGRVGGLQDADSKAVTLETEGRFELAPLSQPQSRYIKSDTSQFEHLVKDTIKEKGWIKLIS